MMATFPRSVTPFLPQNRFLGGTYSLSQRIAFQRISPRQIKLKMVSPQNLTRILNKLNFTKNCKIGGQKERDVGHVTDLILKVWELGTLQQLLNGRSYKLQI